MSRVKNIVLVHGFWSDASSYSQIISALLAEGYDVIAVQNPLTSLADDVAATKRAVDRIDGPCILVGHSWGGMVISEAGNDDRVAGLVYIAALAPDTGESMVDLMSPYGEPSPHFQEQAGFIWISKAGVEQVFASDLPAEHCALLHATQLPPSTSLLETKAGSPAWRHKPSWYLVASNDKAVPPELQHKLANRMGATTTVVEASHAAMISHAKDVLEVIKAAAVGCSKGCK